jgi:glycosyltransferase involved in cell wall biosynthesis
MKSASGMRLMMTTDAVGGVWIFSVTLARALSEAGVEVHLVSIGPKPDGGQRDMLKGHRGISLIETDLMLEWQDPAGADLVKAAAVLGALADRLAPDLIHFNGFRDAALGWNVPTIVVAHSCVNSWAAACHQSEAFGGSEWSTYTANMLEGLLSASAWVAPTHSFCEVIGRSIGSPEKGIAIWNGAERVRRHAKSKQPVILSAGRLWDKAKNLSVLSSAAGAIDWPIRIAGSLRADYGVGAVPIDGCECLGAISHDELMREMEAASIFVSPALYEPFGLSVLEAARAGCALLLSDIPTFRELWEGAAIFFDPRDASDLTQSLQSLRSDKVLRARLQRAATDRAERYPLRNTASRYLTLYQSLLNDDIGSRPVAEEAGVPA